MDEKTIKSSDIPTADEILSKIDTQQLNSAISEFLAAWGESVAKAADDFTALYQATAVFS